MTRPCPAFDGQLRIADGHAAEPVPFDMQHSNFPALNTLRRPPAWKLRGPSPDPASDDPTDSVQVDCTDTPGEPISTPGLRSPKAGRALGNRALDHPSHPSTNRLQRQLPVDDRIARRGTSGRLHVARAGVTRQTSTRDDVAFSYLGLDVRRRVRKTDVALRLLVAWAPRAARSARGSRFRADPRLLVLPIGDT